MTLGGNCQEKSSRDYSGDLSDTVRSNFRMMAFTEIMLEEVKL